MSIPGANYIQYLTSTRNTKALTLSTLFALVVGCCLEGFYLNQHLIRFAVRCYHQTQTDDTLFLSQQLTSDYRRLYRVEDAYFYKNSETS